MSRVRVQVETPAGDIDIEESFDTYESMGTRPTATSALPALDRVLIRVRAAIAAEATE